MATTNPASYFGRIRQKNLFDPSVQAPQPAPFDLANPVVPQNPMGAPYQQLDFGGNNPIQIPQAPPDFDPMASYHPEHQANDAYNQLMAQYPTEQKAGGWRRFGGAALGALTDLGTNLGGNRAGVKGTEVFDEMTGRNKYEKAILDWKNKIGPAGTAAANERYSNTNARQLAYQTGQTELAARKQTETERKNQELEEVRSARQATNDFKAHHPNWHYEQGKDGVLRASNPQNPSETMAIGKTQLSDIELYNLNNQATAQKIQETSAAESQHIQERGNVQENLQDQRAWTSIERTNPQTGQKETWLLNTINGKTKPVLDESGANVGPVNKVGTEGKGESAPQRRIERFMRGQEIFNTRKDLAPYMVQKGNDWVIKPNTAWGAGVKQAQDKIDELTRILYPEGMQSGQVSTAPIPSAPMTKTQRDGNGQTRTLYSFDGGKTWAVRQ